jgi:hypothetical protein
MKRFSTFMLMLIMVCFSAFAKKDYLKYDITGAGSGTEGTCLVKVFIYKNSASDAQFKAAAVHGVIFRGFNGTESRVNQPALTTPDTEAQYQEFYDSFIDEKGCNRRCKGDHQSQEGGTDAENCDKGIGIYLLRIDAFFIGEAEASGLES